MMRRVFTNVSWWTAQPCQQCAEECGCPHEAPDGTCPGRSEWAGSVGTAGCPGVFGIPGSWMTERREKDERERRGMCVYVYVCVCVLHMNSSPLCQPAFTGSQWSENKGTETNRDGSPWGPSMMDYTAENTFNTVTAGSVFIHTLIALYLSAKQSQF